MRFVPCAQAGLLRIWCACLCVCVVQAMQVVRGPVWRRGVPPFSPATHGDPLAYLSDFAISFDVLDTSTRVRTSHHHHHDHGIPFLNSGTDIHCLGRRGTGGW
jgi:hypothetical protein